VSLGGAGGVLRGKPLAEVKELAQKELSKKGVKVVGVSAIVGERLEIRTGSKEQADIVRADDQWTKVLGASAKVRQAQWHPIKVDGVTRVEICEKAGDGWQLKQGVEDLISKSNTRPDLPVRVMKARWLSKPSEKQAGSMVVYLERKETAQQVIKEGTFLIGANVVYLVPFVVQEQQSVRCYNCNQYGHKQNGCHKDPACRRCAGVHETRSCPESSPMKCVACGGAHKSGDHSCGAWQKGVAVVKGVADKEQGQPLGGGSSSMFIFSS
jgi:hypothetical protein